jgi:hypothetical protein
MKSNSLSGSEKSSKVSSWMNHQQSSKKLLSEGNEQSSEQADTPKAQFPLI